MASPTSGQDRFDIAREVAGPRHGEQERTVDAVSKLSSIYTALAESELRGYCPLYETIARGMAGDRDALAPFVDALPRLGMVPVLVFACVHDLVLAAADDTTHADGPLRELHELYAAGTADDAAWPAFRAVLTGHLDEIRDLMRRRSVQTNEVGRTAAVIPALTLVHERYDRPLALIELGPSAGLNLLFDRYHVQYSNGASVGPADSPVQLSCECLGEHDPVLPARPIAVASREGIDLNPMDVTDPDDCRWLEACLWPGLDYRRDRLRAALALAREEPPLLHRGSAGDLLESVLASVDPDAVACVMATWVLGYFSLDDRRQVRKILAAHGETRPVAFVTGEYPRVVEWLPEPPAKAPIDDPRGASLLGVTSWDAGQMEPAPVAWMQAHGTWLNWLPAS